MERDMDCGAHYDAGGAGGVSSSNEILLEYLLMHVLTCAVHMSSPATRQCG
jgi:hypothetical protein